MSSRVAEGPARLEVVLPDLILEQNESAGGVGGTPEAVSPRGRPRPGSRAPREHVFGKLRPAPDGPPGGWRGSPKAAYLCGIGCKRSCNRHRTAVRASRRSAARTGRDRLRERAGIGYANGPGSAARTGRDRLRDAAGSGAGVRSSARAAPRRRPQTLEPRDDQTSILRLTRSTTSVVKSVVLWWP